MTAFTKTVTGAVSFAGGTNLYPGPALYPGSDQYPYGGAIVVTVNHGMVGVLSPVGGFVASASSRTRSFAAVLQPQVTFFKGSARVLFAASLSSGALIATRTAHSVGQALFASLRAAGSLHAINTNLINPPGGGGYSLPMGEDFFQRYKPTLRRQKMRA